MTAHRFRRVAALTAGFTALAAGAAAAAPASYTVPGARAFPEGVAVDAASGRLFVGSFTDGTVFRGRVSGGRLRVFLAPVANRTSLTGMKVDGSGRLIAAGAGTGRVFVYSAAYGGFLHVFTNGLAAGTTVLNDLVATPAGDVYVTDSLRPIVWRIPAAALDGGPERGRLERWLDLRGTAFRYVEGFNANGIELTPDGRALLVVQSATGKLFRIRLSDKRVSRVPIRGGTLEFGDGLLRVGRDLYVARNRANAVARVRMDARFLSGRVAAVRKHPSFAFPTTLARAGNRLLVVNGQLDRREPPASPTPPFTITSLPLP